MAKTTYIAILERGSDGGLGISFPDFPGCVSATETDSVVEARAAAEEALDLHVAGLVEDGEVLPKPTGLHAIGPEDVAGMDFVSFLPVTVEVPKAQPVENERVNVILPKSLLARIDGTAGRLGMNRSSFLAMAAREAMRLDIGAGDPVDGGYAGVGEGASPRFAHKPGGARIRKP